MSRIFISYRSDDSGAAAARLSDDLKKNIGSDNIFFNTITLELSENFKHEIINTLERVDTVLILIGTKWLSILQEHATSPDTTDVLQYEIATALDRHVRGKLRVIPVLVDADAKMPSEAELPPALQPLCNLHALTLHQGEDYHKHLQNLLKYLKPSPSWRQTIAGLPNLVKGGIATLMGVIMVSVVGVVVERVTESVLHPPDPPPANTYEIAVYYGEANGLTLVVEPGSNLRELGLMSAENRSSINRIAEDFPAMTQVITTRTCLHYVLTGAEAALPLECRRGEVTVINFDVNPLETFWYDEASQLMLPIQIMIGVEPQGETCQPEGGVCRRSSP